MSETTGDKVYSGIAEFGKIRAGIGLVVGGFIAIIFFFTGIYLLSRKEKYSQVVNGKIIDSVCNAIYDNGKQSFNCVLEVSYNVNDKEYKYKNNLRSNTQYVDSHIDLYIDPLNHSDATFNSSSRPLGWLLLFIAFFTCVIVGSHFYLTTRFKGYAAFSGASGVVSAFGGNSRGLSPFRF